MCWRMQRANWHDSIGRDGQGYVQNAREPAAGEESEMMVVLREFQKRNPPVFRGSPEPKLAEHWSQMEKILNSMSITDDQTRMSLAAS